MGDVERFFKDVGYKLQDAITAPTKLINSISNALDSPLLLYAMIGLGGILLIKFIK